MESLPPVGLSLSIPINETEEEDSDDCAICFEEKDDEPIAQITHLNNTHDHSFHFSCIQPWIKLNHDTCPVCKEKMKEILIPISSKKHTGKDADETTPLLNRNVRRILVSDELPPNPDLILRNRNLLAVGLIAVIYFLGAGYIIWQTSKTSYIGPTDWVPGR